MQNKRLKSALLAGSLSTFAAAIAATAPAPTPVAAAESPMQLAQAARNPCGAGSPCGPSGARRGAGSPCAPASDTTTQNPCSPGRGRIGPAAAPCGPSGSPCAPATGRGRGAPSPCGPASPCGPSKS